MENISAVEWLLNEIIAKDWWYLPESMKQDIIEQAKAMEKEQIIEARMDGINSALKGYAIGNEEYYNNTYKSE